MFGPQCSILEAWLCRVQQRAKSHYQSKVFVCVLNKHACMQMWSTAFFIFYFFFSALTLYGFSAITAKLMVLERPNLGQGSTLMISGLTLKIKVIGQGHEVKKRFFPALCQGLLGSLFIHADRTICPIWGLF